MSEKPSKPTADGPQAETEAEKFELGRGFLYLVHKDPKRFMEHVGTPIYEAAVRMVVKGLPSDDAETFAERERSAHEQYIRSVGDGTSLKQALEQYLKDALPNYTPPADLSL